MTLKTGMLVGLVGSKDMGVLIQIRASSNTCVVKLNNGTLKKNVPLEDVEEAKDMSDTKEKKSPIIRLGESGSPVKPTKLASMSVKTFEKAKTLEVGDLVKARCNGGSRWFPGRIANVNRDGTYDVEYFDGEIEKKMAPADVESTSKLDKTPKRDKFRVGQSVKARYKGGKRLFLGKIKRVHSDETYDILFDDGDEEKRVKTEHIEATSNVENESDEDEKSGKTSSKNLAVGTKVQAYYKKGRRLFPGKIRRVRSDGTYDIDYDDGEIETHVDATQIQVEEDEENLFADSDEDKKKPKITKKKFIVGDRVKAFYGKGKKLFPGKIAKVHMNGTYDIKYDDGDSELRVDSSLIEAVEDEKQISTKSLENPKSMSSTKSLRVGDTVKAKYKRGTRYIKGTITRERMDGTFDIKYEDGDVEERVDMDFIQRDESEDKPKKNTFKVGDVVKAPFQRGNKLFRGKISRVRSDGTYDVAFDDGDKDTHVPVDLIQSEESEIHDEKPKKTTLKVGDNVKARYKKGTKLYAGTITRVRSDGTYDIAYSDGDVEMRVDIDKIQVPESIKSDDDDEKSGSKKNPKVGDKVRARYNKGSQMIHGEVTAVHRDGSCDVRYEDGDKEKRVAAKTSNWRKESRTVQNYVKKASYKNGAKMLPGKISRVHSDNTYDVTFNDGDSERRVPRSRIKPKAIEDNLAKKKSGFAVGDVIKAKYKKGTKYFTGKISRLRSDGTYDVAYDDGDSETHVDASLIASAETETAIKLQVGDVVKARYKKGAKLFSGKISRVRSDGTYDVKYDDGDSEMYVESSYIEAKDTTLSHDEADDKKPESFTVGDKVSAKYKGGSKSFPGKIRKVRVDGTYDIEFDDGDVEQRVKSSAIESIPGAKPKKVEAKASSDKEDIFGDSDSDGKTNKSVIFKAGDAVEANFKQKGKFHRGTIVRTRSDGTYDVDYDVGASERHVRIADIRKIGGSQERCETTKKIKATSAKYSSDSDPEPSISKSKPKKKNLSSSDSSDHEKRVPIQKGARVTYRNAEDSKMRRIGVVRKMHSDGSCDVKYDNGDTAKRCSDSEDSEDEPPSRKHMKTKEGPSFRRHERVLSSWRRSSRLSRPRMTEKWTKATVLEKNSDGTYTIRYSDGVVEEDAPSEALKSSKKKKEESESDGSSGTRSAPRRGKKRKLKGSLRNYKKRFKENDVKKSGKISRSRIISLVDENFHDHALPNMIPSRIRVSELGLIFEHVARQAVPNKPLDVYLQQQQLYPHHTLVLADENPQEERLLDTSQLSAFAAKVSADPSRLEPALTTLRKRSGAVSLVEIYGSCGFIIDELTSAPTIRNAEYLCENLRFPNNADYWRIRADNAAFQQKIGRFDGATSLLEAVGFVEHLKTHYELRGARNFEGKRVSALEKSTLDSIREKCIQLDGELSLFDGVESLSSILQRISKASEHEGCRFTLEKCQTTLQNLSSVSSQMEWFLWRRKQEIDSLLDDEMRYLHDIAGHFSQSQNTTRDIITSEKIQSDTTLDTALVKMYPYGTNAIETFNKSSIQRQQIAMMRDVFDAMDNGHTMMLAADAAAGDDFIVVQTRQLVLRGAFIRIGAEIPDLLEERMVVKVTSDEHSPAKALVSTVLSPPELAKCLAVSDTQLDDGYKSAQASALLRRVYKDVQDHIVTVSEDVHIDMEELEGTLNVCQDLERVFVDSQHSALLSWPDIEYFVRHTKRLSTPEMFPAPLDRVRVIGSGQVAEVASGSHTSRLAILYFDGRMEIWNLSSNGSVLESGSGTFRFFRLANNCVCPIRQVAVKSVEVKLPSLRDKKQSDTVSSSGIVTYFKVAVDGSKIVFLTGCERILWLACAGSGEILCHINLQVTQTSNYRLLFQIVDTQLPSGEFRTQLYATISAKSYRHVGMWILPQGSRADEALERKRVFTFGDTKTSTTVHLAVCAALLFVASRDGAIIVWSTANDQNSSISPLVCLRIPLHNEELQSLSCQTLGDGYSEAKSSMIQVTVLQPLHPHSLKFALYLFDDGEIIRLQVAENFDLRLVTLEDSAFEFDTFLMPTSGVEQNPARRVVLQKHRIIRILKIMEFYGKRETKL
ncbi:hypothetical protein PInf_015291 [Phytophthora infestans]|nr:hypothetical protein PInf_015291 [Phytophthora infestans]